jgi:isochorismate synthase
MTEARATEVGAGRGRRLASISVSLDGVRAENLLRIVQGGPGPGPFGGVEEPAGPCGRGAVEVVMNLWSENEGTHVFLFEPVPGRVLVGAAPETMAARTGGVFRATAVAGSTGRGGSEEETEALARRLLASAKDLMEHRICVEDAVSALRMLSEEVWAQDAPHVLTLPSIQHLETVVEARLRPEVTVLDALEALHPTPAVCGLPRDRALELLRKEEGFPRGWYAGPVGWFDGEGDGVFVPALRSAVGCGADWHLFAGAGIVEGSDPDREWEETCVKLEPMLRALRAPGREE